MGRRAQQALRQRQQRSRRAERQARERAGRQAPRPGKEERIQEEGEKRVSVHLEEDLRAREAASFNECSWKSYRLC